MPLRGGSSPRIARISVVLPDPFGPARRRTRCRGLRDRCRTRSSWRRTPSVTPVSSTALTRRVGQRLRDSVELAHHPVLICPAVRFGLGDADDRHLRLPGNPDQPLRRGVGRLTVVEQQPDQVFPEIVLERGDVGHARLGVVHHRELEPFVAHPEPERGRHVAEHRLGGGDGGAGEPCAQRRRSSPPSAAARRGMCCRRCSIVCPVRRIALGERCGQRAGIGRHRRRIVPEMRVVAGLPVHEVGHDDDLAVRRSRGGEQLRHPGIVVGAVVDHDGGGRQEAGDGRARLEQMRVLVGIAEDAGDAGVGAGELLRHVAVEILCSHDAEPRGSRLCRGRAGQQRRDCQQQAELRHVVTSSGARETVGNAIT